jgi:hypothetical protein
MGDPVYRGCRDVERWLPGDPTGRSNQRAGWSATGCHNGCEDRRSQGTSTGTHRCAGS